MNTSIEALEEIRVAITRAGIRRKHVAARLGMTESRLSRILAGSAPPPARFVEDCQEAISTVQTAERAAREAFDKAMGG